jgi:hypothetical protein
MPRKPALAPAPLAALALCAILICSIPSQAAQSRAVHEARRPGAPVQLRISRPIDWRPEQSLTQQGVSMVFSKDDFGKGTRQEFSVSAMTSGPGASKAGDVFLLSRAERERIAGVLVGEYTKDASQALTKLSSVKIVKLDGINGVKADYESALSIEGLGFTAINELVYIPYAQNVNKTLSSAIITLHCQYAARPDDRNRLPRSFRSQGRRACQQFYNSLAILDRWR